MDDHLLRVGGDEFMILLNKNLKPEDFTKIMVRIHDQLSNNNLMNSTVTLVSHLKEDVQKGGRKDKYRTHVISEIANGVLKLLTDPEVQQSFLQRGRGLAS